MCPAKKTSRDRTARCRRGVVAHITADWRLAKANDVFLHILFRLILWYAYPGRVSWHRGVGKMDWHTDCSSPRPIAYGVRCYRGGVGGRAGRRKPLGREENTWRYRQLSRCRRVRERVRRSGPASRDDILVSAYVHVIYVGARAVVGEWGHCSKATVGVVGARG